MPKNVLTATILAAALCLTACGTSTNTATAPAANADTSESTTQTQSSNDPTQPDPTLAWFGADPNNVFVTGLTAEHIEAETGLTLGDIVEETSPQLAGPAITFESGAGGVQLDLEFATFEDMVNVNPQASVETMSGYDVLVLGGLGAVIDFPEGPVTVASYDFDLPESGIKLAALVAQARANV